MPAEIVKSATLQAQLDPSGFASGAQVIQNEAQQTTQVVDRMNQTFQQSNSNVKLSAEGWQKFLGSIDPATRAGQDYTRVQDTINKYQSAGLVSANDLAIANSAVAARFEEAIPAAEGMGVAIEGLIGFLEKMGLVLGVAEIVGWGKEVADSAGEIRNLSLELGMSEASYQAFGAALEHAGVESGTADVALRRLMRSMGEALETPGKMRDAFRELGVSAKDLADGPDAAIPKLFQGLDKLPTAAERARLEVEMFGRSGQVLTPAIKEMSQDIDTLKEKYKDLIIGDDVVDKAHEASVRIAESFHKLATDSSGSFVQIKSSIADLLDGLDKLIKWGREHNFLNDTNDKPGLFSNMMANGGKIPGTGPEVVTVTPQRYTSKNSVDGGFKGQGTEDFLSRQQQQLDLVGKTKIARAEENALIEYATAMLKDQGLSQAHVTSQREAELVISDKALVNQIKTNAAKIAQDVIEDKTIKRAKEHENDFQNYLDSLGQETRIVGETAAEREREGETVKAAQELQKQNGADATHLVQTYAKATEYLEKQNKLQQVNTEELKKQNAEMGAMLKNWERTIGNGALPRDQRDYANRKDAAIEKYGADAFNSNKGRFDEDYSKEQRQKAQDAIDDLKDQVALAGELGSQRAKDEEILRLTHQTNGQITEDQKQQVRHLMDLQQSTQDWSDLLTGVESDFGRFFSNVVSTGKFDFKSLAQSILSDWGDLLAKMAERWAEENIFGSSPGGGGGAGGFLGMLSSLFGGSGAAGAAAGATPLPFAAIPVANGGDVSAGQALLVGENGPEMFTPTVPGFVTPNDQLGGGGDTNLIVNVNAPGATQQTVQQIHQAVRSAMAQYAPLIISASSQAVSSRLRNTGKGKL